MSSSDDAPEAPKTHPKKKCGFAVMTEDQRAAIAAIGGAAVQASGRAHHWSHETARAAAMKSVAVRAQKRAELGLPPKTVVARRPVAVVEAGVGGVCEHPRCKTPGSRVALRPNVRWTKRPHLCDACYLALLRPTELCDRDLRGRSGSRSVSP